MLRDLAIEAGVVVDVHGAIKRRKMMLEEVGRVRMVGGKVAPSFLISFGAKWFFLSSNSAVLADHKSSQCCWPTSLCEWLALNGGRVQLSSSVPDCNYNEINRRRQLGKNPQMSKNFLISIHFLFMPTNFSFNFKLALVHSTLLLLLLLAPPICPLYIPILLYPSFKLTSLNLALLTLLLLSLL